MVNSLTIEINADKFSNLIEFYDEVESQLTKDLDWKIGRNLDAFNDVLRGGFGLHEYEEPITIIWKNSAKSKVDFGFPTTIRYIENKLNTCHPSNRDSVLTDLEQARKGQGQTLFDIILEIIKDHQHIHLILD